MGTVQCTLEKNVCSAALGCTVLHEFVSHNVPFVAGVSLLVFCLEHLPIDATRALESTTVIAPLSVSSLKSSNSHFMYLGTPVLDAYTFLNILIFLMV